MVRFAAVLRAAAVDAFAALTASSTLAVVAASTTDSTVVLVTAVVTGVVFSVMRISSWGLSSTSECWVEFSVWKAA